MTNRYTRNCPSCDTTVNYKNKQLLKQAIKRGSKCHRGCLGALQNPSNKVCAKCKKEKSKDEFGTINGKVNRHCKCCGRKYSRKSYYKDPRARNENAKRWLAKNPDYGEKYYERNTEKELTKCKRWRDKNPDYDAQYRANNKDLIKIRNRQWQLNNPDKVRAGARRYRARVKKVGENYSTSDERVTKKEFNYQCYNCKTKTNLTIDHHKPLSKGNSLSLINAVVLCLSCNASKGAKDPKAFYGKRKYALLKEKLQKIGKKHKVAL